MKKLLIVAYVLLMCGCSTAPTMSTSFNGQHFTSAPTSANDPRLGRPSFYRDESDNAWWMHDSRPAH